jgi:hypothetical protein
MAVIGVETEYFQAEYVNGIFKKLVEAWRPRCHSDQMTK